MLRNLQKHIVAQIVLLLIFVFVVFFGLRTSNYLLQKRSHYLSSLVANEQTKLEISHLLQKKLLQLNIKLHDMSNANSGSELNRIVDSFQQLRIQIDHILKVLEAGGIWEEIYPVNFGDEELISRKLNYINYQQQKIDLQIIEMRAKLVELDTIVTNFQGLVETKIAAFSNSNALSFSAVISKVGHYYKGVEPFFVRILENSNRLHFESKQEMERIHQIHTNFTSNYRKIEISTRVAATLMLLLMGWLVVRSSRSILRERDHFQNLLLETNENLEQLVHDRTQKLEKEVEDRKLAEIQLTEQAEFLLSTIESLAHPFYVIDVASFEVVMANSATGLAHDTAGITCHALTHDSSTPCDSKEHPCPLQLVKKTEKPVVVEHTHVNLQGEKRIVEVHGYPIFDTNGQLVQMIEYSLDITDKKEAQQALQEVNEQLEDKVRERTAELEEEARQRRDAQLKLAQSELHFRRLIENVSDLIAIVDAAGTVTYISPSVETLLGYKQQQVISRNVRELVHREDLKNIAIEQLHKDYGVTSPMTHRILASNGGYRVMETSIRKFDQIDGNDEYILTSRDITARKEAEEENLKLQMVVEQSPSSVVMTDIEGNIEYVNPAFEKITGYRFQEVAGKNPNLLKSGRTDPVKFTELWQTIKAGNIWQGEFINRKKNDELYEESVQVIPILDSWGEIKHFVAVKENISDLKRAQQQAESSNRAKSKFLSQMSHELRTPLNAINGFSRLMLTSKKNPLNDKQRDMTEQINSAGKHLLQLINEVLDLAKIEAGEFSLNIEPLDPGPAIEESLSLIKPLADEQNIRIEADDPNHLPLVRADMIRLKQILLNLLSNAVKYNKQNGTVTIRLNEEVPGLLCFEVTDNGIGIAEEKKRDIFTPFARVVDNQEAIEGSGIGMTITKQLVEAMGGTIDFESTLGKGSSFWFTLPLAATESVQLKPQEIKQEAPQSLPVSTKKEQNVLYIEDTPVHTDLMRVYFSKLAGFKLQVAETGEDGMEQALADPPDLILLDLYLPGIDGFQVYRKLKGHSSTEFIPVIAVTTIIGEEGEPLRSKIEKLGFNGLLPKPFDFDKLIKVLQKNLEIEI
ncbi:PAS domain S-box-containing protein [Malonomonas rubra DSM 5091]|uniref:histidine kinase n=1 Tax=Malonomonas rubra DSM 5091 TaxID=1122189 RepID=A0A1M6DID8_MALRU|nr:PAS domain-containing hybrid sensor histidine kinase/response regulator [Malonomonas rubra]SHI72952.1 PAS domain S-box-containing protein [Malonomonas rubra DSM 5091]